MSCNCNGSSLEAAEPTYGPSYFKTLLAVGIVLTPVFAVFALDSYLGKQSRSLDGWPKGSRKNWHKNHKLAKGTSVRVYDSGGDNYADKYTVVMVGKDWDASANLGHKMMLGMSEGGRSVSTWVEGKEGKHLGKRVKWEDLSSDTRKHIERRVLQE